MYYDLILEAWGIFLVNKTDKEPSLVELTFDRDLCDLSLKKIGTALELNS